MEYDPKDIDVISLLKKLKHAGGGYPRELLAPRRQGYLNQVAAAIGGAGLALGLKETLKSGKGPGPGPSSAAGTLVEALLVVAIIAEAGAVAYFYRDKVADFFQSFSNGPKVEEVSHPPVLPSPVSEIELITTPVETPTPTLTLADTPVSTPSVELAAEPTQRKQEDTSTGSNPDAGGADAGGSPSGTTSVSTPAPNDNTGTNGNNGNHYGQTPKPERTKEPGNDNSRDKRDNQDQPKKEK